MRNWEKVEMKKKKHTLTRKVWKMAVIKRKYKISKMGAYTPSIFMLLIFMYLK